jgi:hypothetical protein
MAAALQGGKSTLHSLFEIADGKYGTYHANRAENRCLPRFGDENGLGKGLGGAVILEF